MDGGKAPDSVARQPYALSYIQIQHRFEGTAYTESGTESEVGLNRAPARLDAERGGAAQGGPHNLCVPRGKNKIIISYIQRKDDYKSNR
jgi:hypothetical protein